MNYPIDISSATVNFNMGICQSRVNVLSKIENESNLINQRYLSIWFRALKVEMIINSLCLMLLTWTPIQITSETRATSEYFLLYSRMRGQRGLQYH